MSGPRATELRGSPAEHINGLARQLAKAVALGSLSRAEAWASLRLSVADFAGIDFAAQETDPRLVRLAWRLDDCIRDWRQSRRAAERAIAEVIDAALGRLNAAALLALAEAENTRRERPLTGAGVRALVEARIRRWLKRSRAA